MRCSSGRRALGNWSSHATQVRLSVPCPRRRPESYGLHRNSRWRHIGEPRVDRLRRRPETTAVDHFTLLVESAVMAPYVAKVDADRQLYLTCLRGTSAMRCCTGFFMGTVCSSFEGPAPSKMPTYPACGWSVTLTPRLSSLLTRCRLSRSA